MTKYCQVEDFYLFIKVLSATTLPFYPANFDFEFVIVQDNEYEETEGDEELPVDPGKCYLII